MAIPAVLLRGDHCIESEPTEHEPELLGPLDSTRRGDEQGRELKPTGSVMTAVGDSESGEGSGTSPLTSLSLLERVKNWDTGAWQRLVDLYGPLAYRWCRRTGVKADEVSDVLQEVFLAVATHLKDFRRDRSGDTFRGWLRTITRNKIRDHARRQRKEPKARGGSTAHERLYRVPDRLPPIPDDDQHRPDDAVLCQRVVELIRPGVEERTWRAFWRLAVDGQSGPDVAAELGMSLHAAYQAKYRVLQLARREMDCLLL